MGRVVSAGSSAVKEGLLGGDSSQLNVPQQSYEIHPLTPLHSPARQNILFRGSEDAGSYARRSLLHWQ